MYEAYISAYENYFKKTMKELPSFNLTKKLRSLILIHKHVCTNILNTTKADEIERLKSHSIKLFQFLDKNPVENEVGAQQYAYKVLFTAP